MDRLEIARGLALTIVAVFLAVSVQAKDINSLSLEEFKYLYDLGQVTTDGVDYNSSLTLGFPKSWKEIVGVCNDFLRKTPDLNVDFYIVIRSDGSVSNIAADEIGREKNGNNNRDDSIACIAENIFFISYPEHTFSFFVWKFSYVHDLQFHLDRVSRNVVFHAREIWQSNDSNFIASLSDDGRIYLCIGAANSSLKTIKVLGLSGYGQSVRWGTTYMMLQGELVNINEELPDRAIRYKVVTLKHGIKLEDEKESILLEKRLDGMPAICDRPS